MTTITKDKVVRMHYTLTNDAGEQLDSSQGGEPLAYLHGAKNIIAGLEAELEGKEQGAALKVTVQPGQAYGEYQDQLKQEVEKSKFGEDFDLKEGEKFQAQTEQGPIIGAVIEIKDDTVIVDFNHDLAGVTLHFDVEIMEVRDASDEEIEHGHVHGPGGHQH